MGQILFRAARDKVWPRLLNRVEDEQVRGPHGRKEEEEVSESGPKLFISYCWSSRAHEQWVLSLATELRESGVDVILDKWDLKEGQDAHAFMEKMVVDPEIGKVALICDHEYATRANKRSGGVGTETQILSAEIYSKQDQTKFVAVLAEKNDEGKAYLPAYYKSRIYIDLSSTDLFARNFEQLLRWIYDKPLHLKPDLGETPAFLSEEPIPSLKTSSRFRRAMQALREDQSYCHGALGEYFQTYCVNLEGFRISRDESELDDKIVVSIDEFLPSRNEAVELFHAVAKYRNRAESWGLVHRFFECLAPYCDRPENATSWNSTDSDNFRFIIHELLLYCVAVLLKHECFDAVAFLLQERFHIRSRAKARDEPMVSFGVFCDQVESLETRNNRLGLKRLSLRADLLEQRSKTSGLPFDDIMQADFVLYLRDCLDSLRSGAWQSWWPVTLLYAGRRRGPFEVFARSQSANYFARACCILGIQDKEELRPLLESFGTGARQPPRWGALNELDPLALIGYERLGTLP